MKWVPWLLRAVLWTDEAFDLWDAQGRIDHGKVMGLVEMLLGFGLLGLIVWKAYQPSATFALIVLGVLSAGFGTRMFRRFLAAKKEGLVDGK